MKTWEMIKELTENPEKEFIRTRDGLVIRTDERGYLRWEEGHYWINFGDDWEEVKKPVDFIRLLEKVKNNGDFSSIDYNYREIDMSYKDCNLYFILRDIAEHSEDDRELADSILNGKWYIED